MRTAALALALFSAAGLAAAQPAPAPPAPPAREAPSEAIYPPQHIALRFEHARHLAPGVGATCKTCHGAAATSARAEDRLLPAPSTCDACHGTDHGDLAAVRPGEGAAAACATCHVGHRADRPTYVERTELPPPNLVFNHARHAARNIGCARCHAGVEKAGLATREDLPQMRTCLVCHGVADAAARGAAGGACETCHLTWGSTASHLDERPRPLPPARATERPWDRGGRIRTIFATGVLSPPRWMRGAEHTPDFLERHRRVAGEDSAFCANCHGEDFCAACHDGRVRPRSVHPNDYLSMHAVESRLATQRCTSCHNEQSFCVSCHMRSGITMSGPADRQSSARFHPAKEVWSLPPRNPMHHAVEAQRNLTACVSCHVERDCVACHGARGIGGGFDPHRAGFEAGCAGELRRNPRPCLVCHVPDDPSLGKCR